MLILTLLAAALFVYGALWWSRRLMAWGDAMSVPMAGPPRPWFVTPAQYAAVYGQSEMTELDDKIREYRSDLNTVPCFACDHLPVFHLDPYSPCGCCTQHELADMAE